MFNPRSLKDLQRPKKRSDDLVCLRFHTIGHCFKDCKFQNSHGTLSGEEKERLGKFVEERASKKRFNGRQNRNYQKKDGEEGGSKPEGKKKNM